MNLKRVIKEEINNLEWVKETNYDDALDAYFGITTEPYYVDGILKNRVKVINFIESPYVTYKKIEKVSLSDLYKILTDISKNKSLFTKDLKEFAEAHSTYALINGHTIPTPEALNIGAVPYIKCLAETSGELRRRCLDMLRRDRSEEAERILEDMDDIYAVLVTMDYPNAITSGLRRQTDIVRSITERTRGDLTLSLRQEQLEKKLQAFEDYIAKTK